MDIKAPLEKYSDITQRPVNTDKIAESINLIKNSGIRHEFRTTVLKSLLSEDDIIQIKKLVEGANQYILQKYLPSKSLKAELGLQENYRDEEFLCLKENFQKAGCTCLVR